MSRWQKADLRSNASQENTTVRNANNSESPYLANVRQTAPKDTTTLTEVENRKAEAYWKRLLS